MKITYLLLTLASLSLVSFSKDTLKFNYTNIPENSKTVFQTSEGEKLIATLDCKICHTKDKKIIGPSYLDIAKKYPKNDKNTALLVSKILKGGSGVWGSIPMAAHPNLKKEDATVIVKYILSLNK